MAMFVTFIFTFGVVSSCRLDSSLHGVYKKQSYALHDLVFDSSPRDPLIFDDVTISATSISEFGECYEKSADAYVFGMKRMGRSVCYRCITPIRRAPNVLQLAHQQEDICYDTVSDAKSTCFAAALVSLSDGILIFRTRSSGSEAVQSAACGLDGRLSVGYELRASSLKCDVDGGSSSDSCDDSGDTRISFTNCSFPDFQMSIRCIGSWTEAGKRYIIIENNDNEEYHCGLVVSSDPDMIIHMSNDSSCAHLTESNAFEKYIFRSGSSRNEMEIHFFLAPTERSFSPCQFPAWVQGEFDNLMVSSNSLLYSQQGGSVPVISHCVHVAGNRVLVYSETKCGEPMGYHCLWFNARSDSLIEFKITTPMDSSDSAVCNEDKEFESLPWITALVKRPTASACGILGRYGTPANLRTNGCFNVTVDCEQTHSLRIVAYQCSTGVIIDSRIYSCVASWKDENALYMFTTRSSDSHSCFVAQYVGGRLFLSSTGSHCIRNLNFTENSSKTIIVQEDGSCKGISAKSKASRRPVSSRIAYGIPNVSSIQTSQVHSTTTTKTTSEESQDWLWNGARTNALPALSLLMYFLQ